MSLIADDARDAIYSARRALGLAGTPEIELAARDVRTECASIASAIEGAIIDGTLPQRVRAQRVEGTIRNLLAYVQEVKADREAKHDAMRAAQQQNADKNEALTREVAARQTAEREAQEVANVLAAAESSGRIPAVNGTLAGRVEQLTLALAAAVASRDSNAEAFDKMQGTINRAHNEIDAAVERGDIPAMSDSGALLAVRVREVCEFAGNRKIAHEAAQAAAQVLSEHGTEITGAAALAPALRKKLDRLAELENGPGEAYKRECFDAFGGDEYPADLDGIPAAIRATVKRLQDALAEITRLRDVEQRLVKECARLQSVSEGKHRETRKFLEQLKEQDREIKALHDRLRERHAIPDGIYDKPLDALRYAVEVACPLDPFGRTKAVISHAFDALDKIADILGPNLVPENRRPGHLNPETVANAVQYWMEENDSAIPVAAADPAPPADINGEVFAQLGELTAALTQAVNTLCIHTARGAAAEAAANFERQLSTIEAAPPAGQATPPGAAQHEIAESAALDHLAERLIRIRRDHNNYASAHEGWAVIAEEVEELRAGFVALKREARDPAVGASEALDIAAAAIRFAVDLCPDTLTRVVPRRMAFEHVRRERQRQIAKGFDAAHDDQHDPLDFVGAAMAFAGIVFGDEESPGYWSFPEPFKPGDDEHDNLVKAAAMLIAELERRYRAVFTGLNRTPNPLEH